MNRLEKLLLILIFACSASVISISCASLQKVEKEIPTFNTMANTYLAEAGVWVSRAYAYGSAYYKANPNSADEARFDKAVDDARAALQVCADVVSGTSALEKKDLASSVAAFVTAYNEIRVLLAANGIATDGGIGSPTNLPKLTPPLFIKKP
jgi:hypothetical protein